MHCQRFWGGLDNIACELVFQSTQRHDGIAPCLILNFFLLYSLRHSAASVVRSPLTTKFRTMHLMYYMDAKGKRVYTLKVRQFFIAKLMVDQTV